MIELIGREFKHAIHIQADDTRDDHHMIKEILHYNDGSTKPNIRIIKDFKRPFYVTKPHYQNHKQKKEFEYLDKLNKFYSTQSNLANSIASKTGKVGYRANVMRDVIDNPYIYGVDIKSTSLLRRTYLETYPDLNTENTLCALDIEADVDTGVISMITVVMKDKMFTVINRSHLQNISDPIDKINMMYDKYTPDTPVVRACFNREIKIVDEEIDLVLEAMKKTHEWKPDFVAIWGMNYDLPKMIGVVEKYNLRCEDVFSDPIIPKHLRYFKYKEGQKQRVTESGKVMAIPPEQQWHYCYSTSSFIFIDMMSSYSYVRVGQAAVPGGYSLDNILKHNKIAAKLKFDDDSKYKGSDWHKYMVANKPLEYIVYNMYDTLAMLELEDKTKDMSISMPVLVGESDYDVFNSGPKKIVDGLHFFYLENDRVIGTKPSKFVDDKVLGLSNWIITLPSGLIMDNGLKCVMGSEERTAIRTNVFDLDSISAYPSAGVACNISKQTTKKELVAIEGMSKDEFLYENINLFSGKVNAIEYACNMYNFSSLLEIDEELEAMGFK